MRAPSIPGSLVSLLRRAAEEQPDRRACTLLGDGETETASLTYAELDRRARALAAWLQERGLAGERVLLHHPPGLDFLVAFFGCLYAGAVAVPAFPPRPRKPNPRLEAIRADAGAAAALGPEDRVPEERAEAWRDPGVSGDSLAYLQYTSGSTATPKGVRILHRNVLHNLEACDRAALHSEESVGVTWLPHFHDMGLVYGLLLPLYKRFPAVVIPPVAFLQSPLRWLKAISRYGATHSGGANFAYDLCVRKTTEEDRQGLDLSRWELAYNGSEPVRAATLERFAEAFAPYGFRRSAFYPCYGLAEATLLVAAGAKGAGPTVREGRVGVGRPALDTEVVLVDGEVWVSGPGVADGYWNRPGETAEIFGARIEGRPFLRTGDLGEIHDGVLFVTGRLKDMILVRGTNHYPQDIERTAQESHPALAPDGGAAFSVEADGEERLVVVHEVERTARHGDLGAVIGAIRQAVAEEHQLAAWAVVLIRPGSLPRTTSGKVQRRACRQAFLDGALAVLEEWRAGRADVEGSIRERLAAALGMAAAEVDPDVPLTRYGLDSIAAIELAHGIERDFGVAVPLEELFEGVSLGDLMRLVQHDQRPVETPQSVIRNWTGSRNFGASPTPQPPTRPANGTDTVPDADNAPDAAPDAADPDSGGPIDSWRMREVRGDGGGDGLPGQEVRGDGGGRRPGVSGPGEVWEDGLGRLYGTASQGQRALWYLQQLAPAAVPYNLALAVRISPAPDVPRLHQALQGLVDRHAALRTTFPARDGEPVRVVHAGLPVAFHEKPWDPERLDQEVHRPFDLQNGPLFRAHLFGGDVLLLTAHHIAVDLWSVPILLSDLGDLYSGDGRGRPSPGGGGREMGEGSGVRSHRDYWRDRLAGAPFELDLPFDRPRPAAQTYRGDFVPFRLGPDLTRLAADAGATPFVALLTAFQALLGRITGRDDLLIGAPTSGRTRAALARTVGYLVNPLPLRADLSGSPRFRDLLERTRRSVAADLAHQDLPFPEIVETVQPARDPARHPLFQVVASWQNAGAWTSLAMGEPGAAVDAGGLRLESLGVRVRAAQLDLSLVAWGSGDGVAGVAAGFERNADLFDRSTVLRLAGQLDTLIAAAARDPETRLADLPLMSAGQIHQVLREWNDTALAFAELDGAHRWIEAWAVRAPDAIAVDHEGGLVTYADLNRRADVLADRLRELGAGPEVRVAIRLLRSLDLVVAMLAVAKSGAAWVVLDPDHPPERQAFLLQDADVSILLSPSGLERVGGGRGGGLLSADRAAYIIYTSGSTGMPKGVVVSHASLMSFLAAPELGPGIGPGDRVLFVFSPLFDASINDVYRTLASGATLVVRSDLGDLLGTVARDRITLFGMPTAQWHEVSRELSRFPDCVRMIHFGGEQAAAEAGERWRGLDLTLVNAYGPTETTVCVCCHRLGETLAPEAKVPIGRPNANARLHVLDADGNPAPPGVTGELWIGGPGVARGYLGRPDLTAERFRPDPFGPKGARLYRTGDLARTLADGRLEHLGRTDHQIKLRGFRIEPGEVEAALLRQPGVREAVVATRRSLLVAWIAGTADPAELRRSLGESLPPYMVPAAFVVLPELPKTRTAKIDRRALPDPEVEITEGDAPRTPVEEVVAALWAGALDRDRVGIHDDLFELGGHSLLAARIAARIRAAFGVDLPLPVLLSRPTVAGLAEWIGKARAEEEPPLERGPDGPAPLSPAQERLWFLDQLVPGSPAYNVPVAFRIEGDFDEEALARSLDFLVERHEPLRTTVAMVNGETAQAISPPGGWRLEVVDTDEARTWIEAEARRPFDLERGPLFRAALLRTVDGGRILFLNLHHLICDGWSLDVLLRELLRFDLPPLPVRYADFARWQRERLAGVPAVPAVPAGVELPADRARPAARTFEGEIRRLAPIPGLRSLARQEGATLFMALLAGLAGWLQRITGQDELAVGTPVAGRNRVELEGLVGLFVNTLVLRLDLGGDPDVRELLRRSRETALDAYTRQDTPFEKLVDVQVVLALEDDPFRARELADGLRLVPIPVHTGTAKFDLEVHLWEEGDELGGYIAASRDLFEPATADRMAERLSVFLGSLGSGLRLSELPLMSEAERRQVEAWAGPVEVRFESEPLHRRFEAWARRTPDAVAVTCEGKSLTYDELDRRADRVAADLQAQGVRRGDLVAIQLDRSLELIIAILGVLKAGAAYLPIDEQTPEDRRRVILEDAAPRLVLGASGLRPSPPAPLPAAHPDPRERGEGGRATLEPSVSASLAGWKPALPASGVDAEVLSAPLSRWSGGAAGRGAGGEGRRPPTPVDSETPDNPEDTAYVIYTSGSTGRPKGVMVSHAAASRLFTAIDPWVGFGPHDVWTLFHSYAFDFSVWEIWGALAHGGRLVVVPYWVSRSPEAFRELLATERVTVLSQTPSAFRQLQQADREAPEPLTDLRLVVFGGEALEPSTLQPWVERYGTGRPRLVNMYGITETTVHVTYRPILEGDLDAGRSLIGVPIPDLSLHVLDRALRPVPVGVTGELCVGGAGVARGYLGRPDLTAERFVPDPWGDGQRLYRSGDLARRREDGDLEYLGRADHQVKIRGFRIEPAEIEAALLAHPAVREAVVLARPDGSGGKRLVAFIVADGPSAEELRRFLAGRVAEPMVPSAFVVLDRLPLTPNGKVDRKALLEVSPEAPATEFVAPGTPAERALAEVWAEVFGVERVGVHDNFFALGGDSILSVRVSALARSRGLVVSVQQIFELQTVSELAGRVSAVPGTLSGAPGSLPVSAGTLPESPGTLPAAPTTLPGSPGTLSATAETLPAAPGALPATAGTFPGGIEDAYPLAALQAGMLYHGSRTGGALYHVVTSHHLRCRFDPAAFQAAAQAVAARHPVLRTSFDLTGFAEPVQIVHARVHVPVRVEDLRHLDPDAQEEVLDAWFEDELRHGFDIGDRGRAPLIRFHLHRRTDDSFQLGWSEHHAILDGWSVSLLISELLARYLGTWAGDTPTLPYRDYVALERRTVESEEARRFWMETLEDAEPSALPRWPGPRREKPREGWSVVMEAPPGVRRRSGEIPLKSLLLGVHLRVLAHLSGSRDVTTGVVFNGRPEAEGGDRTLGLFLNTLPLRAVLPETDWNGLARTALDAERAILPWRRYPLSELRRTLGRDPFEVAFNYVHFHAFQDVLGGVEDLGGRGFQRTSFPLLVHFNQDVATPRIELRLDADPDVLTREQLESIAAVYARALAALAAGEASETLLSGAERHQLLVEWNPPAPSFPVFLLHERFEEQAARRPDAVAVSHPEEELTYSELNRRADRLADRLRELGVGPEVPVALRLGRTPRLIVAMLAVLKAGGGYVPLDPAWPKERQEYVLADSGAAVVVGPHPPAPSPGPPESPAPGEGETYGDGFVLEGWRRPSPGAGVLGRTGRGVGGEGPNAPAHPDNLLYILYTSGSTGRPKGVPLSHAAVARLFTSTAELAGFGEDDVFALFHSPAFDVSVWEMWGALLHGGRLVIVPWEVTRSPDRLLDLLRRERVTVLCQTPTAFRQLVAADTGEPTSLRWIHFAGEALDLPMLAPWIANHGDERPRLVNLYGITETTVYLTWRQVTATDLDGPGSIGRPFPDVQIHVVDRDLRPVPVGVPGELLVGGPCLARGYLHRPDLTAERFVPDPFGEGARLYRSGDLARRRPDGELEFLGRIDQQVKIRGHRIEPGEIAARLEQHPAVRQAVVVPWQRAADDVRLVAYIVGHAPESELRAFLRETLPETMVPSSYMEIPALPLTASGKLDRRALPVPGETVAETPAVRPQIGTEAAVAAVWREVLGREEVGLDDNFFDLGGHSILLLRAQARLQEALGREVPMTDLFRYPTVRALAGRLGGAATEKAPRRRSTPQTRTGAIAIVGLACRFPGAADPEAFWRNLRDGVESVSVFSEEELLAAGVDPELVRNPAYVPAAAVLEDADRFDSAFFDMTPREADLTDPQQRVFLECAWEALESAGRMPGEGRTAVFAGSGLNTYLLSNLMPHPELAGAGLQAVVGNDKDFLATRVSYKLDLKGPSLSVQTACSTSLVAVHLACKALRDGECDTALAGGVTIRFPQTAGYLHEEGGIYSPDGRCRAFDAAAGGTVGGSGAGAVALRRLEDALADGDPIRAVILGSAVNNDGAVKVGFTAPGVEGQSAVVADALAAARVAPETVSYIEAHGTGTALGDPIEVAALAEALGGGERRWLGSVKTNIGHLDTAAGVAGLIKTVLALEHREIPATLHYREPNPRLDLTGFRVADRLVSWTGPGPRRAGVSSLGMGGTNAHVVLEEAPAQAPSPPSRPWQLLVLSARTEEALETAAGRLAAHVQAHPELDLADVAHTLRTGRRPFRHRRAIVCQGHDFSPHGWSAEAGEPAVAFLFPGQGEQRSGMAADLVRDEPVFRAALDHGLERLLPGMDLWPLLSGEEEGMDRTLFAQPALLVFEYALAQLWLSWGLRPTALLGHSLGEWTAACLAGVVSLDDALRIVTARARLMDACPPGAMLSVPLPEEEVLSLLSEGLDLAAVNAPGRCVVSGPVEEIDALPARLPGVACRRLATSHAFHSRLMDAAVEPFAREVARAELKPPRIPIVSSRTGTWMTDEQATDPGYWSAQLRQPVRFGDAAAGLAREPRLLLEVGPGRALTSLARRSGGHSIASFPDPHQPAQAQLLQALGRAWAAGAPVDWTAFEAGERRRKVPLPTYPFERRRHLIDPPGVRFRSDAPVPIPVRAESEPLVDFLARVWREALGVDRVGPDDDFFELGGDSVIGLQIAARLRDAGYDVSSAQLFDTPTVAGLAAELSLKQTPEPEAPGFNPAGLDERTLSRVSALLEEIDREP